MTSNTPAPESKLYRVGEVSRQLNLTLRTLKYYEELGLVTPQRTAGGYRMYTGSDVQRLERIRRARALGLSLKTIQSTFTQPQVSDAEGRQVLPQAALQDLASSLEGQLAAISGRIAAAERELREARALRRELQGDLAYVRRRLGGKGVGELLREVQSGGGPAAKLDNSG